MRASDAVRKNSARAQSSARNADPSTCPPPRGHKVRNEREGEGAEGAPEFRVGH